MKFGRLPKNFGEYSCAFDALEKDDYFPILGYVGSCPNCTDGKYPKKMWGIYQGKFGHYHLFLPMEEVKCGGCGAILVEIYVLCMAVRVNVSEEFGKTK